MFAPFVYLLEKVKQIEALVKRYFRKSKTIKGAGREIPESSGLILAG